MIPTMILLFVVGYLFIALEHKTRIDKSAVALLMAGAIWTVFSLLGNDPHIQHELVDQLGDTCEILVFLIGAMTIVDLIDSYGGFNVITDHITTRNKRKLMWLLAIITFFMSAALDNMTTTIIMVMLLRRLIANKKERWIFASVIVIAANSGGAWSPIGDVTTIMLWMRGNVTAANLIANLFLPCLVSVVIPAAIASRYVADRPAAAVSAKALASGCPECIGPRLRLFILIVGVVSLLFVPVFKSLTGLPPYMGMMVSLGFMWILTEIIYDRKRSIRNMEESIQPRVSKVLKHIDMPTILFFLGILMAVGALQTGGVLTDMADWLDKNVHEVFTIAGAIGILSSVVDNVPLVAACMGMYPVADVATAAASADPAFAQSFVADGLFWHLLTYCAGVGGSLLIIGSAAGVVAMGLEKINFGWYLKRISLLALSGYLAGIAVIWLERPDRALTKKAPRLRGAFPLLHLGHEFFPVDDVADVDALANQPLGVAGPDIEGQLAPLDFGKHGRGGDFGAKPRRLDVRDVHLGADGGRAFGKFAGNGRHGGVLHQRHHRGGGENRKVARTHRGGRVAGGDGCGAAGGKSFFKHNIRCS